MAAEDDGADGAACSAGISGRAGAGSNVASAATGTSSHNRYANAAPSQRRAGTRTASTRARARPAASAPRPRAMSRSCVIVELLDQSLQFGEILLAQFAGLGEVRDQRRDAAAEQAVDQTLALAVHIVLALEPCTVEVAFAVARGGDGALLEQAIEQGLDRRFLPVAAGGQRGDHVLRAQ